MMKTVTPSSQPPPDPPAAPPPVPPGSRGAPQQTTLWRELADGTAHWGVRLTVTLALAVAMGGLVPILAYFIAASAPSFNRGSAPYVYPDDGLVAFLAAMACGGFLAVCAWLWTRSGRRGKIIGPVLLTLGIAATTFALGVVVDANLRGASEMVVAGFVLLAGACVALVWLNVYRTRPPRWRPLHDRHDGFPDVRCPTCNYRMVGLTESRCPECGTAYTLDELIARQGFGPAAPPHRKEPPALRSA
jgi:hypothetical protein